MSNGAVVLLSGGQDSTTCLLLAIEQHGKENVYPVSFYYAQKHSVELDAARNVCKALEVRVPEILHIQALRQLGGGAITSDDIEVNADATGTGNKYAEERSLPSTVVPGRNVVFLALAAGYGAKLGIYELWTGGCLADYDGYPDCRPEFYERMQETLRSALLVPELEIVTPLTQVSKGETFFLADRMGYLGILVDYTHTCYNGEHVIKHTWGYGCGECPACKARAAGWEEFMNIQTRMT